MSARYLVVFPPGAAVESVGFVKAGQSFEAPRKDYLPSRRFRAVNEEAVEGLKLLQALLYEESEKYSDLVKKEKGLTAEEIKMYNTKCQQLKADADGVNLEIYDVPSEKEVVRDEVSLHEMGEKALEEAKRLERLADQ